VIRGKQSVVVGVLGLSVGLMSFEQLSISYLMPFISPALHLSNAQVGWLMSLYWCAFSLSSYVGGRWADALGSPKRLLTSVLVGLSVCCTFNSAAMSFTQLAAARVLMGLCEGALLTIAQTIVALTSSAEDRATNVGVVSGICPNILGILIAPLVVVPVSIHYGWRAGFWLVPVPGLVCAFLVAWLVGDRSEATASVQNTNRTNALRKAALREVLRSRNVWLSAILCSLFVAYLSLGFTFIPLLYVEERHFSSQQMSFLMGTLGVGAVLHAYLIPAISDRLGRRKVVVAAALLSLLLPYAALYYTGPLAVLAVLMALGWAMSGCGSIYMGTIPAEAVSPEAVSTAIGAVMSAGVLLGGLLGPSVAGWSADVWGLTSTMYIQAACAALAALIAIALQERNDRRTVAGQALP
jgi:predicted MFS family arabinose efflux permease